MLDLYVYYKLREERAAALAPRVRAMQARLAVETGVRAQLKRRPAVAGALQTWMEIYPNVDAAFAGRLDAAAGQAGITDLLDGPRRTETFEDLPCA